MLNQIKKDFTIIPNELINDENINSIARFLFVWLASKPESWTFHNTVIEKSMKFGRDSRIKYLNELKEKGWINVFQKMNPDGTFGSNQIKLNPYPMTPETENQVAESSPHTDLSDAEKIRDGKIRSLSNTNLFSNNNINSKKEPGLFSNEEIESVPKTVIKFLNDKKPSKTPFQLTDTNIGFVKSRIKEGFKIGDFKKVIEYKVEEWKDDPKMKKFIRPETLFGTKFNRYLVEAENNPVTTNDGSNNFEYNPQQKADML